MIPASLVKQIHVARAAVSSLVLHLVGAVGVSILANMVYWSTSPMMGFRGAFGEVPGPSSFSEPERDISGRDGQEEGEAGFGIKKMEEDAQKMERRQAACRNSIFQVLSKDKKLMAVAKPQGDCQNLGQPQAGTVDLYALNNGSDSGSVEFLAQLKEGVSGEGDYFGASVSIETEGKADIVVVGAPRSRDTGTVVFGKNTEGKIGEGKVGGSTTGTGGGEKGGNKGQKLLGSGAVYIFSRQGHSRRSGWVRVQKLVINGKNEGNPGDYFGASVSISKDILLVGAPGQAYDDAGQAPLPQSGAVYLFKNLPENTAAPWVPQQKIVASNRIGSILFGMSVMVGGDNNLMIGSFGFTQAASRRVPQTEIHMFQQDTNFLGSPHGPWKEKSSMVLRPLQ